MKTYILHSIKTPILYKVYQTSPISVECLCMGKDDTFTITNLTRLCKDNTVISKWKMRLVLIMESTREVNCLKGNIFKTV